MTAEHQLPADVIASLKAKRKIEAIKLLREQRHCGLKEAKEMVDAHLRLNPDVNPQPRMESGAGRLVLIVVIIAAAYGAYTFAS